MEAAVERFTDPFDLACTEDGPLVTIDGNTAVDLLEASMREQLPILELPVTHHFAEGTYARELFIPAGTLLTGKIHKTQHLNIVSRGVITVWSEEEGTKTVTAPYTFVAQPGTRRVGFAHEDTVWTTIHATDETDLERLEEQLIEKREPRLTAEIIEAITGEAQQCLG